MNSKLLEKLQKELLLRKEKNLLRQLRVYRREGIDFSSNDYLGLNFDGLLHQFLWEVLDDFKTKEFTFGSTGSRLISGHREIYEEVERDFSIFVNNSDSVYFTNGYVANVSTIFALLSPKDYAIVDQLCHASILDGIRISKSKRMYFSHNDYQHLQEIVKKIRSKNAKSFIWIFTEAIFSMDGDSPNLQTILQIATQYDCIIFLDEAHSIGIVGNRGEGMSCSLNLQKEISVITYPLGKAMGIIGCFVTGNSVLKEYLINFARGFIFSTATTPLILYVLKKIISFMLSEEAVSRRNKVYELSQYTREQLLLNGYKIGLSNSHIVPILIGGEEETLKISDSLRKQNFNVVAIRPPTVPIGTSRIRLNLHSHNTKEEVDQLIYELNRIRKIDSIRLF